MASRTLKNKQSLVQSIVGEPTIEPSTTRGQKRREMIKLAARKVLEKVGYHAMKVTDVATEAGIAAGLFYHYFPDLKTVTCEVLGDFLKELEGTPHPEAQDRYDVIYIPTLVWAMAYEEHPGLMRCLIQVADEVPEFRALWNSHNTAWTRRIAKSISRRLPETRKNANVSLSVAYALGSMVDGLITEVYVHRNNDLRKLLTAPQETAELLSTLWYRAMYLENPPLGKLKLTKSLSEMVEPDVKLAAKDRGE